MSSECHEYTNMHKKANTPPNYNVLEPDNAVAQADPVMESDKSSLKPVLRSQCRIPPALIHSQYTS